MFVRIKGNVSAARSALGLGLLAISGCGSGLGTTDGGRPTMASSILQDGNESPYYESNPNNFLETAEYVGLEGEPRIIHGHITGAEDVDVYHVGSVKPGDRIVAEMSTDASLDGVIALFDENGASLLVNNHRNYYLGVPEPFVDVVIRRSANTCYVAVSATPGYGTSGDYTLFAYKQTGTTLPAHRPDTVLLIFNGGDNVTIGSRAPIDVPPFDAASIDPVYAGQTADIIERVVAGVRADYAGLDVTILSTSEGATFDGSMTQLFFGRFDEALLGVAENVDEFNASRAQEAIVFTDTFAAFMPLNPTVPEMAQAIANVASHETGHLLGLIHTSDREGIMDVTASLRDLLADQSFRFSPLYSQEFPIGSQDAIQSLLDTVGGDPALALMKYIDQSVPKAALDAPTGPPARAQFHFGTCGLHEH